MCVLPFHNPICLLESKLLSKPTKYYVNVFWNIAWVFDPFWNGSRALLRNVQFRFAPIYGLCDCSCIDICLNRLSLLPPRINVVCFCYYILILLLLQNQCNLFYLLSAVKVCSNLFFLFSLSVSLNLFWFFFVSCLTKFEQSSRAMSSMAFDTYIQKTKVCYLFAILLFVSDIYRCYCFVKFSYLLWLCIQVSSINHSFFILVSFSFVEFIYNILFDDFFYFCFCFWFV